MFFLIKLAILHATLREAPSLATSGEVKKMKNAGFDQ